MRSFLSRTIFYLHNPLVTAARAGGAGDVPLSRASTVVFGEPTPKYTVYQNIWGGDPFDIRILRIAIPLRFAIMQKDVFRILSSTAARVFHKLIVPYLFFFVIAMIFATMFYVVESGDLFIDCELNQFAPKYPGILRCCCVVVVVGVVDRVFT